MWLAEHWETLSLDEEHQGYFYSRGAKQETLDDLKVKTWTPLEVAPEDPEFARRYGPCGEYLEGWIIWPLMCPKGNIIGFSSRDTNSRKMARYNLPQAFWTPVFTGMSGARMLKIWSGAHVWVVEGIFDLFALEWRIKDTDVVLATGRARLSSRHVDFFKRFVKPHGGCVYMVYDNDEAGKLATYGKVESSGSRKWGALDKLKFAGVLSRPINYRGKDPGEIWSLGGKEAVLKAFS